jgi:hypothetical protein
MKLKRYSKLDILNKKSLLIIIFSLFVSLFFLSGIFQQIISPKHSIMHYNENTEISKKALEIGSTWYWGTELSEVVDSIAVDSLGNIYVAGHYNNTGDIHFDIFLVKFDVNGNELWNATWGGPETEHVGRMVIDSNDDIFITGDTRSYGSGNRNLYLIKYNSSGSKKWNITTGQTSGSLSYTDGYGITFKGTDIYVVGATDRDGSWDLFLAKFDMNGNEQWNKTWGGSDSDYGVDISYDSDSDRLFITARTDSYGVGDTDIALLSYTSNGVKVQNITWGGVLSDTSTYMLLSNNDIYITGYTENYGNGNWELILLKFNRSLQLQWFETWGGTQNDIGNSIAIKDSNIYVSGWTWSYSTGNQLCLIELYSSGNIKQSVYWGSDYEYGKDIVFNNGDLYMAVLRGQSSSELNLAIMKWNITPPTEPIPGFDLILLIYGLQLSLIISLIIKKRNKRLRL